MTDAEREREINDLGSEIAKLMKEGRKEQAQICFMTMAALMAGRSDEVIKQMEQEQGLSDGR